MNNIPHLSGGVWEINNVTEHSSPVDTISARQYIRWLSEEHNCWGGEKLLMRFTWLPQLVIIVHRDINYIHIDMLTGSSIYNRRRSSADMPCLRNYAAFKRHEGLSHDQLEFLCQRPSLYHSFWRRKLVSVNEATFHDLYKQEADQSVGPSEMLRHSHLNSL